MPIPGPSPVDLLGDAVVPTGSPFWLRLHGQWVQLEGISIDVPITSDRLRSEIRSTGGSRYEQRSARVRRQWDVTVLHAAAAGISVLAAAAEADEVWLASDHALTSNMLASRDCFGRHLGGGPTLDCGGVPLAPLGGGSTVTGYVRGGVPTTLSCWSGSFVSALTATYPGGTVEVDSLGDDLQTSATFTPSADGEISIFIEPTVGGDTSGLMLTEGDPSPVWLPGEAMPCKVVIDDRADSLLMFHTGAFRHDYGVTIREVD